MVLLQKKIYFSKEPAGIQHFPRGGGGCPTLSRRRPNANFYRNPYNL